jgi:hypothetical protein
MLFIFHGLLLPLINFCIVLYVTQKCKLDIINQKTAPSINPNKYLINLKCRITQNENLEKIHNRSVLNLRCDINKCPNQQMANGSRSRTIFDNDPQPKPDLSLFTIAH